MKFLKIKNTFIDPYEVAAVKPQAGGYTKLYINGGHCIELEIQAQDVVDAIENWLENGRLEISEKIGEDVK